MKKGLTYLGIFISALIITSCSGGYTCPTYMKKDADQKDVLVKIQNSESIEKI